MARKLQQKDVLDFWKEVKIINNNKVPLPSNIDGVTGSPNIADLWKRHYEDLFNCVKVMFLMLVLFHMIMLSLGLMKLEMLLRSCL